MKKFLIALVAFGLIFCVSGLAMAGNTASQSVSIIVQAINELADNDVSPTLTINATTASVAAGDSLFTVTDSTHCKYSVTTNSASEMKITAQLSSAITETAVKLYITLASMSGSTEGEKEITDGTAKDVVTGLSQEADSNQAITYKATAGVTAPIGTVTKSVTLTLTTVA
jgi:hypothetical protein